MAEQLGYPSLQGVHGRILGVDVVADLGGRHRLPHPRGGFGQCVGSQVHNGCHESQPTATRLLLSRRWEPAGNGMRTGMIGKIGRVTGRVGPGLVGEVLIAVRGGVEAFYAYPQVADEEIPTGQQVLVVDYQPPRTVYVERWFGGMPGYAR